MDHSDETRAIQNRSNDVSQTIQGLLPLAIVESLPADSQPKGVLGEGVRIKVIVGGEEGAKGTRLRAGDVCSDDLVHVETPPNGYLNRKPAIRSDRDVASIDLNIADARRVTHFSDD
jgi:hypothetical protein